MRYRGGGVGHRILWPLRDIMLAVGHTRPKHQRSRKGKEPMKRSEESDGDDDIGDLEQTVTYDADLTQEAPDEHDEGPAGENDEGQAYEYDQPPVDEYDQSLADEMSDYEYESKEKECGDIADEEEEEFDHFA